MSETDIAPRKIPIFRRRNVHRVLHLFALFLIFAPIVYVTNLPTIIEEEEYQVLENLAVMNVTGGADSVILVERYFYREGEIEGDVLARYTNDTQGLVNISADHRDVKYHQRKIDDHYYDADYTYLFYLYYYDGPEHIREQIAIDGNTSQTYTFNQSVVAIHLLYGYVSHISYWDVSIFRYGSMIAIPLTIGVMMILTLTLKGVDD